MEYEPVYRSTQNSINEYDFFYKTKAQFCVMYKMIEYAY